MLITPTQTPNLVQLWEKSFLGHNFIFRDLKLLKSRGGIVENQQF